MDNFSEGSISIAADSLKLHKELGTLDDAKLEESVKAIVNSTKFLSETIDDFRNYFSPSDKKEEFSTLECFNKALKLVDSQIKNHDIKLIYDIPDCRVFQYQKEFIQVLIHILNNAKDELIKNRLSQRYIFVKSICKDKSLDIHIKDNAGGVEEKIIDRIFEPYFTTKHQYKGRGVGLYISLEIISKHMNGEISVSNQNYTYNNKEFRGAEFIISIPKS